MNASTLLSDMPSPYYDYHEDKTDPYFSHRSEGEFKAISNVARIIYKNLTPKLDRIEATVYVIAAREVDLVKIGFTEKTNLERPESIMNECGMNIFRMFDTPPFEGAHRAEQITHGLLQEWNHRLYKCYCKRKTHTEWFRMTFVETVSYVRMVHAWFINQRPYDMDTGQLRLPWKNALDKWRDSQTSREPWEWLDFFSMNERYPEGRTLFAPNRALSPAVSGSDDGHDANNATPDRRRVQSPRVGEGGSYRLRVMRTKYETWSSKRLSTHGSRTGRHQDHISATPETPTRQGRHHPSIMQNSPIDRSAAQADVNANQTALAQATTYSNSTVELIDRITQVSHPDSVAVTGFAHLNLQDQATGEDKHQLVHNSNISDVLVQDDHLQNNRNELQGGVPDPISTICRLSSVDRFYFADMDQIDVTTHQDAVQGEDEVVSEVEDYYSSRSIDNSDEEDRNGKRSNSQSRGELHEVLISESSPSSSMLNESSVLSPDPIIKPLGDRQLRQRVGIISRVSRWLSRFWYGSGAETPTVVGPLSKKKRRASPYTPRLYGQRRSYSATRSL